MKTMKKILKAAIISMIAFGPTLSFGQNAQKPSAAVLNIDSKGVIPDAEAIGYMVRLELEKTNNYGILDKYDVKDAVNKNGIDIKNCFGKSCVVSAGKTLQVDKMITGSVERFAEKIIITLKVIDIKSESIEKSNTTEYLNLQQEMQKMIEISVKRLLGIEPDAYLVEQLVNYDSPIASPKTQLRLNGPRMGVSYTLGETGKRLEQPKNVGGFDMYPVTFQFGWQQEFQYLSAGNFQGLFEFVGMIGGLESGKIIPSLTIMNGFRWGKSGWEFGFGPNFRLVQRADGFYDEKGYLGNPGEWHLKNDYATERLLDTIAAPGLNPYPIVSRLDSRGSYGLSTGLMIAAGKTFRSGYLNMPVNIFVSPRKEGTIVGFSMGFNIYKQPRVE